MATTLDDALDILHQTGPDLQGGGTNHGPLVVEALCALGRADAVSPWLTVYTRRCQARPVAESSIDPDAWHTALGDRQRGAAWVAFFEQTLAQRPWPEVVQQWVPRLTPGLMAAAAHGLLRTAHAVRSLAAGITPQRLHELAEGLGYWAACYQVLPGSPTARHAGYTPPEAIQHVPRLHGPEFDTQGSIVGQIKGLDAHPEFAGVIDLVETPGDLSAFLSQLTATFAGIYLANTRGLIAFVHAVTAPSALRLLAPYLSVSEAQQAARYTWQACAGIYAWYATVLPPQTTPITPPVLAREALIDRAVAAGGAHTIKFTEACLREYALHPAPVFLAAAYDAADRVRQA
jgi:hypothetical protein